MFAQTLCNGGDHHGLMPQGVPAVLLLGTDGDEIIALAQALLQGVIDIWRRCPRRGLEHHSQVHEGPGINQVGLGLVELGMGKVMRLGRIDGTDTEPGLMQTQSQFHPVRASCFVAIGSKFPKMRFLCDFGEAYLESCKVVEFKALNRAV